MADLCDDILSVLFEYLDDFGKLQATQLCCRWQNAINTMYDFNICDLIISTMKYSIINRSRDLKLIIKIFNKSTKYNWRKCIHQYIFINFDIILYEDYECECFDRRTTRFDDTLPFYRYEDESIPQYFNGYASKNDYELILIEFYLGNDIQSVMQDYDQMATIEVYLHFMEDNKITDKMKKNRFYFFRQYCKCAISTI